MSNKDWKIKKHWLFFWNKRYVIANESGEYRLTEDGARRLVAEFTKYAGGTVSPSLYYMYLAALALIEHLKD